MNILNLNQIHKAIGETIVAQKNSLRFECARQMEAAIRSCDSMIECHRFLNNVFPVGLVATKEIFQRVKVGESFAEVTNDLNLRGLL